MDEKFFAWLDGELDPAEAAAMEARVAADPELARAADQHRALALQMRDAFAPIAMEPVSPALRDSVRADPTPIDFTARREAAQARRRAIPQWAAMAATLAIGVFAGTMIDRESNNPVQLHGGQMVAAASLGQALDSQLASNAAGDGRIGLTFRDQSGTICRSFTAASASGLACRDGDNWRIRGLFAAPEGQESNYRMASGVDPALAALIESTIDGEPFDARQESAAKARGWR